jgi:NDP-sugar pyrophosphorylase family protein
MKAMLLAAGEGTRLRPHTDQTPKPMLGVGGKPLLEHSVRYLVQCGITEIIINLHHRPEVIQGHFGDGSSMGARIHYSYEPKLLGTAGAVKNVESQFSETFLVLYGDNLTNCALDRLRTEHENHGALITVALHRRDDVSQSGVAGLNGEGRITCFVEKPAPGTRDGSWVNAGILLVSPRALQWIPPNEPYDFGRQLLPRLLEAGQPVYGYLMEGGEKVWWIDRPEDYDRVCDAWRGGMPQ